MHVTLTPDEVRALTGGYRQPSAQLRELHRRGYWRAHRSPITGAVIVERAHYEAVASGATAPQPAPRLRPPATPTLKPAA